MTDCQEKSKPPCLAVRVGKQSWERGPAAENWWRLFVQYCDQGELSIARAEVSDIAIDFE